MSTLTSALWPITSCSVLATHMRGWGIIGLRLVMTHRGVLHRQPLQFLATGRGYGNGGAPTGRMPAWDLCSSPTLCSPARRPIRGVWCGASPERPRARWQAGRTDGAHAVVQPPRAQPALRDLEAAALAQQHVGGGHAHVLPAARAPPSGQKMRRAMQRIK